eukprot:m.516262 g.516262  ORF g.516262 m.516262 type:complete len:59 (+) comp21927_c3_seq16:325-501(+)
MRTSHFCPQEYIHVVAFRVSVYVSAALVLILNFIHVCTFCVLRIHQGSLCDLHPFARC